MKFVGAFRSLDLTKFTNLVYERNAFDGLKMFDSSRALFSKLFGKRVTKNRVEEERASRDKIRRVTDYGSMF